MRIIYYECISIWKKSKSTYFYRMTHHNKKIKYSREIAIERLYTIKRRKNDGRETLVLSTIMNNQNTRKCK